MTWSLHQLAPVCVVPHCPKYGTRHLLDHQFEIACQVLAGNENYIYWQGGVGSAKTLLWGVLAAALALMIPNSRGILFRKDYGLNYETLWRYFKQSIKAACDQEIIKVPYGKLWTVKKQGEYTLCTLPNGSVVRCGQTKNWSEFMGPSYDFILISDAMENNNFGEIFHGGGVVGGLRSRLRGQASSFFQLTDSSVKDLRRFLIESNPPPIVNELHEIFGRDPGIREFPNTGITYRHIQTSSILNDHNPASYVAEIASAYTDLGDLQRIIGGQTVPYYGGVKVIPQFTPEIHINSFEADKDLPLFIGIDNGYQHPAIVFSQIKRCAYEKEHFVTLSEISNLYNVTTKDLVEKNAQHLLGLLAHLGLFYPEHFDYKGYLIALAREREQSETDRVDYSRLEPFFEKLRFAIDKSSLKTHSSNKDRETDRGILLTHYGIRTRYRTAVGLERSLNRVRGSFTQLCGCNIPIQLIDKKCELLIDGYSGGYRFKKNADGTHSDKPIEDHRYEDVCDAHRYCLENFFFITPVQDEELVSRFEPKNDPYVWAYGLDRF